MAASMVVSDMAKVKQPLLTAVCRNYCVRCLCRATSISAVDREAPLDPGRGTAVDVGDRGETLAQQKGGCRQAALPAVTDGVDRPIAGKLRHSILQLPKREEHCARHVPFGIFPRLPHIEHQGWLPALQKQVQLVDQDGRHPGRPARSKARVHLHLRILDREETPQAWQPRCVKTISMSKGQQYLQFFGSDPLKRLHGCAVAESDRGADSPCAGLARPLQRPQIGFGNPQAAIVFLSPSPLDPASASNEAFGEWLDLESSLEHHMTAETPQRYFQFVRAVLSATRKRLGQEPGKRDVLEHAFHSWAVHCATAIPDRVTDAALNQCAERHLVGLLGAIAPSVIVAMGGPLARYFWASTMKSWDDFKPITALHGRVLKSEFGGRTIPVVLSVHPYQTRADSRPEVVARAIAEQLASDQFEARQLKAA